MIEKNTLPGNFGYLYLADHGSTNHVDSLFQDCTTVLSMFAYHNEHMYVCMCLSVLYL